MSVLGKHGLDEVYDDLSPKHKKQRLSQDDELSLDNNHHNINLTNDGVIVLNVGGVKYQTTIQTITGYQSMLKARFSSKYAIKASDDGSYFIDGDGKLFPYILKYLRTGTLLLPTTWKKSDIWEFYIEAKYFMIESLFNKILLRLFDSKIMRNDILKLKVINKISETLKWNKNETMESLKEWRKIGSIPNKTAWGVAHSLTLIQTENKIYGIFITRFEKENSGNWFFDFVKSFAFNCGANSCHLLSSHKEDDMVVDFKTVRKLSDDEKKMTENNDETQSESVDVYKWFLQFHPLSIRGIEKKHEKSGVYDILGTGDTYTAWRVKFWDKDDDKYRAFSNNEIWSIPM